MTQPCVYPWANCTPSHPARIPTRAPTGGTPRAVPDAAHVLAFTGADIALLVLIGVALIIAGLTLASGATWRRT